MSISEITCRGIFTISPRLITTSSSTFRVLRCRRISAVPVEDWAVADPMGGSEDDFREAREKIEMLVMRLILRVRSGKL